VLATIRSAALSGVHAQPVWVEVHISEGLPGFQIVGLPDTAVRESRERARAAVLSSDLSWPNKRMTVNLAPGDLRKSGSGLELAVACGVLSAAGVFPAGALDGVGVLGELGLDGTVRPVRGAFVLVDALARAGVESVIVPHANATEAALVDSIRVLPVATLGELGRCLKGEDVFTRVRPPELASDDPAIEVAEVGDLADVRGLTVARRALEIAAAGRHHLLLVGPPGAGKTLVAQRFPTICSPLDADEAIDVTRVHSVIGANHRRRSPADGHSAPRTTHALRWHWWAAAAASSPSARSRRPTTARCSSMSWASSRRARSSVCANRSKIASSDCRASAPPSSSRRTSN